ncbi:uncharacterized protein LOC106140019 [Amyelois transitella]|uniref:uncharacterized protein LOC106140019 n=1 Tax=Amyelois transitella TaxID=680683 RepID=UPI00067C143A|nr:uncharacterized protein LOC106140019 [Amyelois transitella]
MFSRWLFCLVVLSFAIQSKAEYKVAIAHLISTNVTGRILFTEVDGGVLVTGNITGLPEGNYGFHIHQLGDITTCDTTGAHFNPDDTDHGGQNHTVRHVGDLGNIAFVGGDTAIANVRILDTVIALTGRNSIVGRALVLHEGEDDLGQGGHESSLTTGNAGGRVACGVIGIMFPVDPWNSAGIAAPSLSILAAVAFFAIYDLY